LSILSTNKTKKFLPKTVRKMVTILIKNIYYIIVYGIRICHIVVGQVPTYHSIINYMEVNRIKDITVVFPLKSISCTVYALIKYDLA